MSQIHAKSPQHCAKKKLVNIGHLQKKLFFTFTSFFSSLGLLILILWFIVLRPTKPHFSLKQADIYQLVVSGTHLLNASIQLTLLSTNPNQKLGIYYDEIQLYASYKAQQITLETSLQPFYQEPEDNNLLSAVLIANGLPVAPSFNYELDHDQIAGRLILNFKANGLLRWKVGTWVSGKYRFNVNCVSLLLFSPSAPAGPFTAKQGAQCSTTI